MSSCHLGIGLKGGSWVTTGNGTSRFVRVGYRRHFFQHCGFRLARSTNSAPVRLCDAKVFVLGAGVSGESHVTHSSGINE